LETLFSINYQEVVDVFLFKIEQLLDVSMQLNLFMMEFFLPKLLWIKHCIIWTENMPDYVSKSYLLWNLNYPNQVLALGQNLTIFYVPLMKH